MVTVVLAVVGFFITYQAALAPVRLQIRTTQTAEARATALASALAQTPAGPAAPPAAAAIAEITQPPAPSPIASPDTPTPEPSEPAASATPAPPPEASPIPLPTGIPRTPLPFQALFFACRDNPITHGGASLVVSPGCPGEEREGALQLAWTVPDRSSFTGCTISLETIAAQALENSALVFWARAADPGETLSIKLLDASGEHTRLVRLSPGWQQVVLPFLQDFPDLDLQGVRSLTIGIDYDPARDGRKGRGSACFSQPGFGSP